MSTNGERRDVWKWVATSAVSLLLGWAECPPVAPQPGAHAAIQVRLPVRSPKPPDVFVLSAAVVDRPGEAESVFVYEPGALAHRLSKGVELRPYLRLRSATETGESVGVGLAVVFIRERR